MENRIGNLNKVAITIYGLAYGDLSDRECAIVARIVEMGGEDLDGDQAHKLFKEVKALD